MPLQVELEIAIDAPFGAALEQLGIQRVELCADLGCDGLTPEAAMLRQTRRDFSGHLAVLVRRTRNGFEAEGAALEALEQDARMARDLGADSIVAGVLSPAGMIDLGATARLVAAAGPCVFVFHRAFDRLADLEAGYRQLAALNVSRVLTSAGAPSALAGLDGLRALGQLALKEQGPRLMAAGGIRAANAVQVASIAGVAAIHRSGMQAGALDTDGIRKTLQALTLV